MLALTADTVASRQSVLAQQQQLIDAVRDQGGWFTRWSGSPQLQSWWTSASQWLTTKSKGALALQQLAVPDVSEPNDIDRSSATGGGDDCELILDFEDEEVSGNDVTSDAGSESTVNDADAVVVA